MENSYVRRPSWFSPNRGSKVLRIIGMTIAGVAFAVVFAFIFGLLVMLLWNWLMPLLFGLKEITYWQAFGIVLLAKLLFGGFGHHRKDPSNHFHKKVHERWHDSLRGEKVDDSMMDGWKYYKQYWHDEGKTAFEDYMRRAKEKEEKNETG